MVDFERMVEMRDSYVETGNAERIGGITINRRQVPADEWAPDIELCTCGNMLTFFEYRCEECWEGILLRRLGDV